MKELVGACLKRDTSHTLKPEYQYTNLQNQADAFGLPKAEITFALDFRCDAKSCILQL